MLYTCSFETQIVPKLGPLEWILNTPSHHRVHHGRNPYCIDNNYGENEYSTSPKRPRAGGTLIIWDRLFGTFAEERDGEPIAYGK